MNDIILSALLNLFALFGSKNNIDAQSSLDIIDDYLSKFYGIRNTGSYTRLYSSLREYYDDFPELDKNAIVDGICSNLHTRIRKDERVTLLLRLMEFCAKNTDSFNPEDEIFVRVAELFSIEDAITSELVNFISDTESKAVRLSALGEGTLKTLFFKNPSMLLFSYTGLREVMMNDVRVENGIFHIWEQSSVLKGVDFKPLYYATVVDQYEPQVRKDAVELRGNDINFRFANGGDNGMHNFSFLLHSGEMVAIMGGSGVGKTTLLSLLNGNLRPQSGSITINGHDISEPEAKALIGFVPQDDLLIEELTVYQNLWYTAKLCFNELSDEELDSKVMQVLVNLGLEAAKDLKVGSPINKFISGGQRKRLNIALELIREPAILYLDEPTSGLSSSDTETVVSLLKEQTYKGKLIVVNIHQPSSDVYKMFDRLWLLDKGGYPVYDGNPIEAVSYFKGAANYADYQTSSCPVCGNINPEIILNIIDEKRLDNLGQLTGTRKVTPQEWHEMYLKERPQQPELKVEPVPHTDQKRPGGLKQLWIFLCRNVSTKITNLQYILVTLLEAPLLACVCGLLTRYTPDSGIYTLMDNKNFPSYLFMAIIVSIFLGMSGSAEEIIRDRALLKREKFLNLSHTSYIWSKMCYMAVVCLIQTLLFILVGNAVIGVHGMFWYWWIVLFVSAFLSALIGLLLSQCLSSVVAIYITIPLLLIPQILLCGLVVNFEDLNPNSETGNVPVLGDVIPSRWAYEALSVASFTMNEYEAPGYGKDRERYEALYYDQSFIYELKSQLETREDEIKQGKEVNPSHIGIVRSELPQLARICNIEPYDGDDSYDSLMDYIDGAKKVLSDRANKSTLALDRQVNAYINAHSQEEYLRLKSRNYNLRLEDLVVNRATDHLYTIVGNHIVPRSGYVYLTPRSRNGRAPFYSGVKVVGSKEIPTFWFNMCIMLLMCLLISICLFSDVPGKYIRKEQKS
ncbi:MAG: ATP-binding cassette domain-containing protein [Bacteroidales bacterium]|nr:ATP-binding cassette domain-containing protein [Bacteroidales bacterium]